MPISTKSMVNSLLRVPKVSAFAEGCVVKAANNTAAKGISFCDSIIERDE